MPPQSPHFWCHQCQREVQVLMAPDPICQTCNGQFVEQIEPENDPRDFIAPLYEEDPVTGTTPTSYNTFSTSGPNSNAFQFFDSSTNAPESGGALYSMLNALLNGNLPTTPEQQERGTNNNNTSRSNPDVGQPTPGGGDGTRVGRHRQPVMFMGSFGADGGLRFRSVQNDQPSTMPGSFHTSQNTTYQRTESPRPAENRDARTVNMINLIQMISGLSGSPISLNFGGSANPGDYVFSQTGLDNIITQLMEQANSDHAPPPATEEIIEGLEKKKLTETDLEKYAHCAICTDDFNLNEEVTILPCEHGYHADCITPWLKVNGTCPVCRYSLITGQLPKDAPSEPAHGTSNTTEASTSNQTTSSQTSNPTSDSRTTTFSWESTIPGAFRWGGHSNNQTQQQPPSDNTNHNASANENNPSSSSSNPPSGPLDLD
ncbi:hypothetical protein BC943DRAFT_298333 [Umbelopsis sp. AD052]|nr:hypothetical protein BC943DRAFT_298333 [Umbelopsis sp. AD052]